MDTMTIKKESWFKIGIEQGKEAVEFDVWAHPAIEDYFRKASTERFDPIEQVGYKKWFSGHGDAEKRKTYPELKVGRLKDTFIYSMSGRHDYTFEYVGYPLNTEELSPNTVNLGFLRIPGISQGDGIKFSVEGVLSNNLLRELKPKIGASVRSFVKEYLVPVRFELEIIGREL